MARDHFLDQGEPRSPTRPSSEPGGMQRVAAAVLRTAIDDASLSSRRPADRLGAVRFLGGGPDLSFWIQVLGCDEREVKGLIARVLNGGNGNRQKGAETP